MQKNYPSKRLSVFALIAICVLFLANSSNPPNGRTGAPGDVGTCAGCHGGSNPNGFDGSVEILNFPNSIDPGTTYNLTARVSNPNGLANRGGFQAVVLNETTGNSNSGDLMVSGSNPSTVFSGGREYVEHSPAINFPGSNGVTWDFEWVAPSGAMGDVIKIYTAAVIGNGSGSSGDFVVTNSFSGTMAGGGGGDPLTVQITASTDVNCFGGNDGTATAEASDGAGSYSYNWSNGESGANASMLPAGLQSVTVTDANSATATASIMINQPTTAVSVSIIDQTDINCINTTGSATASGSGGTPGYTYLWDNGESAATAVNLSSGTHFVTATDILLCEAVTSVFINTDITAPIADAGGTGQIDCNNSFVALDGSASDGGANISYLWTTPDGNIVSGATSTTPIVDQAGTYTITVSNNINGCTASSSTTVTEIAAPTLSISGNDLTCFGSNDGSITLSVNGGAMPFTFDWNDDTYDGIQNPTNIPAGNYAVTLTDGNNCVASASIQITSPSEILLTADITNLLCNGDCDGAILLTTSGGSGFGYTYNWANGDTANPATGLCAGDIGVTVTDGNGCTQTEVYTIAEPTILTITGTTTDATCGECNGSITTNTSGGTAGTSGYTYDWGSVLPNTPNQSNVCPGSYTVTVTDNNNCTTVESFTVNSSDLAVVSLTATDVSCNGVCDGTVTSSISGGAMPITYLWSNGDNSSSIDNLCAGNYQLTLTDGNGCTYVNTATVGSPASISISFVDTDPTCFELCDGTIALTTTGGNGNFTYQWSGGIAANEENPSDLCAGTYSVTATDANGCTNSTSTTLTEPSELTVTSTVTNATCNNECTGSISLSVNGGTMGYTYSWSNDPSNNSSTNSNLCAGDYIVSITDANGCTITLMEEITEPSAIQATASTEDELCNGDCDGQITLTISGGNQPYTFNWSNTETSQNISDLCQGDYTVTISDANNCTFTLTASIAGPQSIVVSSVASSTTCNNECDGSISLSITGGTGNFDFNWSDSSIGNVEDPVNLCAGNYTVTITDQNGCTAVNSTTITEPTALIANASATSETASNANDGTATANPSGGTGDYSFDWSNGSSNQTINNLSPNTYTVTVTDDNNCTAVETVTVNSFDCNITTTISGNNILCNGGSNGSATVTTSGGNGTLTYDWSSGGNSDTENNLSAGAYTVTVTDANNCSSISNITLTEPAVLSLSISGNDPLCASDCNGDAEVIASGGTAPYNFLWSNSSTDDQVNNLCEGFYSVTVSDNNNCTAAISIELNAPSNLSLAMSSTAETAPGANDGTATANVSGGTAGYTEQWDNGQSGVTISNLAPGTYCVTITDLNGCSISNCVAVAAANCDLEITGTTNTNILCNGEMTGSLMANTTGGTSPITYSWSNGGSGQTINNLPAGNYTVTATDSNACSAIFNTSITEPTSLNVSVSTTNTVCNGECNGTATPVITGGTEPYSLVWTPAGGANNELTDLCPGGYTLFVTDFNNCTASFSFDITEPSPVVATVTSTDETSLGANDGTANVQSSGGTEPYTELWSNGAGGISIMDLAPGTYCVTISDFNGCTDSNCITVNGVSCDFTATITQTNINCNGASNGTAMVNISGGTTPFSYSWSSSSNNTNTETNLAPGAVSVTITDNLGCSSIQSITITEPTAISLSFTTTDESSSGAMDGSITVNTSGGTLPIVDYSWDTGANTQTINNLSPGNYCVTVTDANACTSTACTAVNAGGCTLAANTTANNVSCFEACDGFINLDITGGTEPITYQWSNGETTQDISGLCAGDYFVTITDINNCQIVAAASISEPSSALVATAVTSEESADGANDGSINLIPTGGTPMYTYNWSNGETTEDLANLTAGDYCVTITDANACTFTDCFEVTVFDCGTIGISAVGSGNICTTDCNGSIDITVSGGDGNYSFIWSNDETTEDLSDLCNGNYFVTVTDGLNCTSTQMVTISSGNFMINEAIISDVTCAGLCDGMVAVTTSSGTGPFTYDWNVDDFDGMTEISDLCPGIYDLTVTDGNGCTEFLCFDIDDADEIQMTFTTTPSCPDSPCSGTVSVTTSGGTAPYEYSFDTDGVSFCLGEYFIEVTDALGCTTDGSFTIIEAPLIEFTLTNTGNDTDGQSNGFFEITVSGGVPDYTFEWTLNGNIISTDEDPQGLAAGNYSLMITDDNGCSISVMDLVIDSTTPSSEPTTSNELQLFPNPTNGLVHILLENQVNTTPELVIFDISGKQFHTELLETSSPQQWTLNVQDLPDGVYTLQVKGDGFVWWEKLVKME